MTDHPDEPLPGATLFVAQRAAEIRNDEQGVRYAVLSELAFTNFEAPAASGEREWNDARVVTLEQFLDADFARRPPDQTLTGTPDHVGSRAVEELETFRVIESEHAG